MDPDEVNALVRGAVSGDADAVGRVANALMLEDEDEYGIALLEQSARMGDPGSVVSLWAYAKMLGRDDIDREWFERAIDVADADELDLMANTAFDAEDLATTRRLLVRLVDRADADVDLLRRASQLGDLVQDDAVRERVIVRLHGMGLSPDALDAFDEEGDDASDGDHEIPDVDASESITRAWVEHLAESGDAGAMVRLYEIILDTDDDPTRSRRLRGCAELQVPGTWTHAVTWTGTLRAKTPERPHGACALRLSELGHHDRHDSDWRSAG